MPIKEIRLYDIDQNRNRNMEAIVGWMLEVQGFDNIKLVETQDPELAFENSNFIYCQIRVGGLKMRELDEKVPLKYHLVGQETCGVGGFSYGLRTIGPILKIVEYVQKYAPEAWILNYTNPESIVSEAVRRKYPQVKMVNACDMTISIEKTLEQNYGYNRNN